MTAIDLNGPAGGTSTTLAFTENDPLTPIAPEADTAIENPASHYDGHRLTVELISGGTGDDLLRVADGASFQVDESGAYYLEQDPSGDFPPRHVYFATISGGSAPSEPLVIVFNRMATLALVEDLLRAVAYQNVSDSPAPGDRIVSYRLVDAGGSGAPAATATITVEAVDDPATPQDDQLFGYEHLVLHGNVLSDNGNGEDLDPDGTAIAVTAVNGEAVVGQTVTLPSGARLTLDGDGTFSYDPNGKFDYLTDPRLGAAGDTFATDSFTYTIGGGATATVNVSIYGSAEAGDVARGTEGGDLIDGSGTPVNSYDVSQGGDDWVIGSSGDDHIFYGGAFTPGDRNDGGSGTDTLGLFGTYSFTFDANDLVSVERLALYGNRHFSGSPAAGYSITTVDANVGAAGLFVTALSLGADEALAFNGTAETNGRFTILSGAGADTLAGGAGGDHLNGGAGDDQLFGLAGDDTLIGGLGTDTLRGGFGRDTFRLEEIDRGTAAAGREDRIVDFERGLDRIDVSAVDAGEAAGDQAFAFLGSGAFSGSGTGELRVAAHGTGVNEWLVEGDADGDGTADFAVLVTAFGPQPLTAADFVL